MSKAYKPVNSKYLSTDGITYNKVVLTSALSEIESNISTNTTNIDSNLQKININISNITKINTNKVLWSGAYYMHANHSITLKDKVLNQTNGIVCIFSAYRDSAAQGYDWSFTFIPKYFVSAHNGQGTFHVMGGSGKGVSNTKYLYIRNDSIVGHKNNDSDGYVLRYVIGV